MRFQIHFLAILIACTLVSCFNRQNDDLNGKNTSLSGAFEKGQKTNATGLGDSSEDFSTNKKLSIKLTPFIPEYGELGNTERQLIADRLNAAVSTFGYGGNGANPRFIIGTGINIISKNITSSAPTKYANTYEVTLMVCDVVTETIFESLTFQLKGVGDSPAKAFINGFRDYNFKTEVFYNFLSRSQEKLNNYYEQNCAMFMRDAETQAKLRNFDAAFTILNNVPLEAVSCSPKVETKKAEYFQQTLNQNCQSILASMKAELGKANDPSASGFNEPAMAFYQLIDRKSSCAREADALYRSYLKKLNPKAKRDWEQQMQQYKDKIKKMEQDDQFRNDSTMANFEYLSTKSEMQSKAEMEGNKKLLQKYQYDELPWLRKLVHLGKYDPFDRIDN